MVKVPRSIPSELPRLLFEAEAPLHSTPWMDRPVISGGTILLAGGGIDVEADSPMTLLAGIDVDDGRPVFTLRRPCEWRELFAGVPGLAEDGTILLPVRAGRPGQEVEGAALKMFRLDPSGETVSEELIDATGADTVSMLVPSVPQEAGGRWAVSWRDADGFDFTTVSRVGDGRAPGILRDTLLCAADGLGVLVAETGYVSGLDWNLKPRWRVQAEALSGVHVEAGRVIAVEMGGWDEHLGSGGIPPSILNCHATADGTKIWREIARGTVPAVLHAPHVVLFVEVDGAGRRLVRIDASDGAPLGSSPIDGTGEPLTIVAADHTHALWSEGTRLVCEVLADPGRRVWELEIPEAARAGIRTMAVDGGRIVARVKNRVWAWG